MWWPRRSPSGCSSSAASSIGTRDAGRFGPRAFFGACGTYFFRFLRLAVVAAAGYALLFGVIHGWLFEQFYPWATRDVIVERSAFLLRAALYAVFLGLLAFWNVVMDYAKIRAVVEDRRSMLGAFLAGWRFVVGHPLKTGGLYALNAAAFAAVLLLYGLAAPGAAGSGWVLLAGFAAGQTYLLGPPRGEAGLLRVADGVLPALSRTRGVHRRAPAALARVARGRGDHQRGPPNPGRHAVASP